MGNSNLGWARLAKNLQENEEVYVPAAKLNGDPLSPSSLVKKSVLGVDRRSIIVDIGGGETQKIASRFCHRNIGVMLINIGDFATETTLLDPLAESVLQYCRLLVPDDFIMSVKVRSLAEIRKFWKQHHQAYSHVILVGHGGQSGITFANGGVATTEEFISAFEAEKCSPKTFISSCCQTEYKSFGGVVSGRQICERFIGPFHSVHGATASQFIQTFLAYRLLEGQDAKVAFKYARSAVVGGSSFRLWRNRALVAGPGK